MSILHDFLLIFLPLFVVVDPAGMLPLYVGLTAEYTEQRRVVIARRATVVAAVTGVSFIVVGQAILAFLGVAFADFQIAGGILLVVLSIVDLLSAGKPAVSEEMLRGKLREAAGEGVEGGVDSEDSISVVPLAVPLIVGPATLTTGLLLVNTFSGKYEGWYGPRMGSTLVVAMVCVALVINLLILYGAMRYSRFFVRLIGKQAMAVINKIVMILLAAIAVSLIRRGITSIVHGL